MKNLSFPFLFPVIILTIFVLGCAEETPKKDAGADKTATTDDSQNSAANNEAILDNIKKFRADGEDKLVNNKFTRKLIHLKGDAVNEDIKQKWESMAAYYEGDKLIRIQLYPHKNITQRSEEFYVMDDKLVFAFIQDKGPKHEGKDMTEPGKEFYFDNDRLINYVDRSGDKETNIDQEKKMYEAKLPYEVSELLKIIKLNK